MIGTASQISDTTKPFVKSDEIGRAGNVIRMPREKLPEPVLPFHKAAARLIEQTFPGPSWHAIAKRAHRETGASISTVERILRGETGRIDAEFIFTTLSIFHARTGNAFPIGGGFEISVTQAAQNGHR